jgi:ornithine cyclodeaminase
MNQFPLYDLTQIRGLLRQGDVLAAVRNSFIIHSRDETICPPAGELLFSKPPGDCHIKYGHLKDDDFFIVKVATGFYHNPQLGLPTNSGLVGVFSKLTGETLAIFDDQGWLTSWRTAASGVIAAQIGAPSGKNRLGIIGTGHQAELQAMWIAQNMDIEDVVVWGRSFEKAQELCTKLKAADIRATPVVTVKDVFQVCRVVVTCTPSSEPLVRAEYVQPGTHIVALGADSGGKQEVAEAVLGIADIVYVDDVKQSSGYGELSHAIKAGTISLDAVFTIGEALSGMGPQRKNREQITVADLTGLAAHDIAMAGLLLKRSEHIKKLAGQFCETAR